MTLIGHHIFKEDSSQTTQPFHGNFGRSSCYTSRRNDRGNRASHKAEGGGSDNSTVHRPRRKGRDGEFAAMFRASNFAAGCRVKKKILPAKMVKRPDPDKTG
jgi:hypothetical protein